MLGVRGGGGWGVEWLDSNLNLAEVQLTSNDWKIGFLRINTSFRKSLCSVLNEGAGHQASAHNLQTQHNLWVEELNPGQRALQRPHFAAERHKVRYFATEFLTTSSRACCRLRGKIKSWEVEEGIYISAVIKPCDEWKILKYLCLYVKNVKWPYVFTSVLDERSF